MRKVVIIGPAGAGKSTLARELGAILKMDVFHLDRYFWQPGWKEKSKEDRVKILQELVQKSEWIIEGAYFSTSDIRLQKGDTVIFLDMPILLCTWRVLKRRYSVQQQQRPDLPAGCSERLNWRYMLKLLLFPFVGRKTLLRKLRWVEREKFICLHSEEEVKDFLDVQRKFASALPRRQEAYAGQMISAHA
jgi:adenylate kinase family enzyme